MTDLLEALDWVDCGEKWLKATLFLTEVYSAYRPKGYVLELRRGDLKEDFIWIPSDKIEGFSGGDLTDWPCWIWLACKKIVENKNRNLMKGTKWFAVFMNSLRSVVLDETGYDFKR